MDTNANIVEVIKKRLELMGMSQAEFARCASTTPAQMGIFLQGKGSLSTDRLNKSFDLLGINLSLYSERINLAKEVADYLLSKNVSSIDNWTKNELAEFAKRRSIIFFYDVQSEEEYNELMKSGIIDIECTYPYFKALVSYYLSLNNTANPTASQAEQALSKLLNSSQKHEANISKQMEQVDVAKNRGVLGTLPLVLGVGFAAMTFSGIIAGKQKGESKHYGAFALFAKTIMPNMQSLFAKAMEYMKK